MRLVNEESGIAMPLSLLVFLFLSFLCMSVFAIGEVVRSRTELQYKVDRAVYAAALVQADSISRIGVLNRAMAWTYVQVNRMQMDYIMNRWLSETKEAFINDADECLEQYSALSANACTEHILNLKSLVGGKRTFEEHTDETMYNYKSDDRFYGLSCDYGKVSAAITLLANTRKKLADDLHGVIDQPDSFKTGKELKKVFDTVSSGSYVLLEPEIETGRANLETMQKEIAAIQGKLAERMQAAVDLYGAGNASVKFALLFGDPNLNGEEKKPDYFEKENNEEEFYKKYKDQVGEVDDQSWRGKSWWQPVSDGIGHVYSGNFMLQWYGYYVKWVCDEKNNVHKPLINKLRETATVCEPGVNPNPGGAFWPVWWNQPVVINPGRLKKDFFGKAGALVVGAKMAVPDLFAGIKLKNSFWSRFKVDCDMWCVAAARAGYRIPGDETGRYENAKCEREGEWNLFADDWDAVFLPVGRCWKNWNGVKFEGESAESSDVLSAVKDALAINDGRTFSGNADEINKDMLH